MKKGDKFVILSILLLSFALFGLTKTFITDINNRYVSVQVDGKEVKKITLDDNMEPLEIPVDSEFGDNIIVVDSEGVSMKSSSCPDQICVHMHKVTKSGEMIVCLPNRLLLEIKGDDSKEELDIIVQ